MAILRILIVYFKVWKSSEVNNHQYHSKTVWSSENLCPNFLFPFSKYSESATNEMLFFCNRSDPLVFSDHS
jgi:hypothetical protein